MNHVHLDSQGDLYFSFRDNGVRGTLVNPLKGEPVYLSLDKQAAESLRLAQGDKGYDRP